MSPKQKQIVAIMCEMMEADFWNEFQFKCEEQDIDLDEAEDTFNEVKEIVNN